MHSLAATVGVVPPESSRSGRGIGPGRAEYKLWPLAVDIVREGRKRNENEGVLSPRPLSITNLF